MALATPAISIRGQSPSAPEGRGVRGLWRHTAWSTVADAVIEAILSAQSLHHKGPGCQQALRMLQRVSRLLRRKREITEQTQHKNENRHAIGIAQMLQHERDERPMIVK